MSYQVLARKFRPQNFEEIVGQEHVRTILKNAVVNNTLAHAYLFSGTRGVGKTTAARIFAKSIMCANRQENGDPCGQCANCTDVTNGSSLDYFEIDGASNNSVENVRELIDNVHYLPVNGKYKVYVIDEVHMLTVSAFNALLKTLEEPPAHVVFIFATTDPGKLIDTVVSRCQKIEFKNLNHEELKKLIQDVSRVEEISFATEATINALCEYGQGSGRDVLSALELLKNISQDKVITENLLSTVLGIPEKTFIKGFVKLILTEDVEGVKTSYERLVNGPIELEKFHRHLLQELFEVVDAVSSRNMPDGHFDCDFTKYTLAELLWVYEVMAKDFIWIEQTPTIEQCLKLLYVKVAKRSEILNRTKSPDIELKKKDNTPLEVESVATIEDESMAPVEEVLVEEQEELPKSSDFYFQDFVEFLYESKNSFLATHLERGNLIDEAFIEDGRLSLILGFSQEAKVFYDVVNELETRRKIREIILENYTVEDEYLNIEIRLLDDEEKDIKNFRSKAEIDEENIVKENEDKKDRLLNNVYIKAAENIFESTVNKVVLDD